jgi:hypothetical protein
MSSHSRISSERRPLRAAAVLLALVAVQCLGTAPALAAVPLPVAAVLDSGGTTSLVVDLSASGRPGRSASITRGGAQQPAQLVPVVSAGLAVALVVDASAAGAATLPAWLSAAARFILEMPYNTQAVVIADRAPAAAITAPQRGPTEIVRSLTSVTAQGGRDTAAALTLANQQFPGTPVGRRVVVYYTTAADAGGESAAALGARFRASGIILVVVGTADTNTYWADAAMATGGFFAPAGNPVVVPALDQVQTTLRGRYLVQFRTPAPLPARVPVRVDTGDLTLTGDVVVPAPPPASASEGSGLRTGLLWGAIAAVVLAILVAGVFLLRRRTDDPSIPRERAPAPDSVALGRASVPETSQPDD